MKKTFKIIGLLAIVATLGFSSCKKCKDCNQISGFDNNDNPTYSNIDIEACDDDLETLEAYQAPDPNGNMVDGYKCE